MKKAEEIAPRYLTVAQAAAYLSLSPKSIYRLIEARKIPFTALNVAPHVEGKPQRVHYRFDRLKLDEFMAQNSVVPPKELAWRMPSA